MDIIEFREFCLSFAGTTEGLPFGGDTLVFKVKGKMFCLTGIDDFEFINVKCDPDEAVLLREQYPAVRPGYHMSKTHCSEGIPVGEQCVYGRFCFRYANP